MEDRRKTVAIIGGGIAGLGAAWLLGGAREVTLYEAGGMLGGTARTVDFPTSAGPIPVEMGVVIFDPWTFPNVFALFDRLGVTTDATGAPFAASFGSEDAWVQGRLEETPLGRRIAGDCARFEVDMARVANLPEAAQRTPLRDWLPGRGYSEEFLYKALFPLMSLAVLTPEGYLDVSLALYSHIFSLYFSFFSTTTWRHVPRGLRTFVEGLASQVEGRILLSTPVTAVTRLPDAVLVQDARGGRALYDDVIFATRADIARSLLTDGTSRERELLAAFPYWPVRVTLHRDERVLSPALPRDALVQYVDESAQAGPELKGRLSGVARPELGPDAPIVTFSWGDEDPSPAQVVMEEDEWMHSLPTARAIAARGRLHEIQGVRRTWFCGGYTLLYTHEAALVSGMAVAERLGASYPFAGEAAAARSYREQREIMFPAPAAAPASAPGKKAA